MHGDARFLPTPQQIAEECAKIQSEWTDVERESRSCYPTLRWSVPGSERNAEVLDRLADAG